MCLSPRVEETKSEVKKSVRTWTKQPACVFISVLLLQTSPNYTTHSITYNGWYAIKPNQTKPNKNNFFLSFFLCGLSSRLSFKMTRRLELNKQTQKALTLPSFSFVCHVGLKATSAVLLPSRIPHQSLLRFSRDTPSPECRYGVTQTILNCQLLITCICS